MRRRAIRRHALHIAEQFNTHCHMNFDFRGLVQRMHSGEGRVHVADQLPAQDHLQNDRSILVYNVFDDCGHVLTASTNEKHEMECVHDECGQARCGSLCKEAQVAGSHDVCRDICCYNVCTGLGAHA